MSRTSNDILIIFQHTSLRPITFLAFATLLAYTYIFDGVRQFILGNAVEDKYVPHSVLLFLRFTFHKFAPSTLGAGLSLDITPA